MEKIIFICLLSLSLCLSSPTEQAKPNPTVPTVPTVDTKTNITLEPTVVTKTTPAQKENHTETSNPQTAATLVTPKTDEHATATNETSTKTNNAPTENSKPNVTEKAETTVAPTVPTKPAETKATTVQPTALPKPDDDKKVIVQARGFDGGSFIGGIILTLGMLAIGFIGFKYYKAQTERNYHTL